jgi:hypothetical protein
MGQDEGFQHFDLVDAGSVAGSEVLKPPVAFLKGEPGVVGGDGVVMKLDGVVRRTADQVYRLKSEIDWLRASLQAQIGADAQGLGGPCAAQVLP